MSEKPIQVELEEWLASAPPPPPCQSACKRDPGSASKKGSDAFLMIFQALRHR